MSHDKAPGKVDDHPCMESTRDFTLGCAGKEVVFGVAGSRSRVTRSTGRADGTHDCKAAREDIGMLRCQMIDIDVERADEASTFWPGN